MLDVARRARQKHSPEQFEATHMAHWSHAAFVQHCCWHWAGGDPFTVQRW